MHQVGIEMVQPFWLTAYHLFKNLNTNLFYHSVIPRFASPRLIKVDGIQRQLHLYCQSPKTTPIDPHRNEGHLTVLTERETQ